MTDASKEHWHTQKDLDNRFTYHTPTPEKIDQYALLRNLGKELAEVISEECPHGRERSLAITKLEEVIMWANASIARNE